MAGIRCTTTRLCMSVLLAIVVVQFVLFYRFLEVEWIAGTKREFSAFENEISVHVARDRQDNEPPSTKRDDFMVHKAELETATQKLTEKFSCTVKVKEALSALSRARTAECRDELTRVACLHQSKTLYWSNFSRSCPVPDNPAQNINLTYKKPLSGVPRIRILFMLTVHGRAVRQVCRLFKRVYHRDHYYLIHVDSVTLRFALIEIFIQRSNYMYQELTRLLKHLPNVELTRWRMATIWGGASLLQMLLRAMAESLHKSQWKWDFFINLSESDYLIKPLHELVDFLTVWHDKNFLRGHGGHSPKFIKKQGLDQTFHECETHMWRIGPRNLPEGIHIDGGSDWIIVNRRYVKYLIYSKDPVLLGLKQLFKYSLLPAESFFHTVLRNSEQCQTFVKHNLRLTNWKRKLGCRCQYRHIVDWCGCSPNNFLSEDFPRLKNAPDRFFARKFEAVVNMAIINIVDVAVFGNWPVGTAALMLYWESLYHVDDHGESYSDETMTTYRSFVRRMSSAVKACLPPDTVGHLIEVTLLEVHDNFTSVLPRASYSIDDEIELVLEGQFTPVKSTVFHRKLTEPLSRVKAIEIGTVWDKKEYVYRNYASIFDIMSELVVTFRVKGGTPFTVIAHVYDPAGKLVRNHTFIMEAHWVVSELNLQLSRPLQPGQWHVDFAHNSDVFAGIVFAIPPREVHNRMEVGEITFPKVHKNVVFPESGAMGSFTKRLQTWTDKIVGGAWKMEGLCSVRPSRCATLKLCSNTAWSSFSPDPKSAIGIVKRDGLLH